MFNRIRLPLFFIFLIHLCQFTCTSAKQNDTSLDQLLTAKKWQIGTPLRLHLGCGQQYFSGYINIDFPPSEHTAQTLSPADMYANITELQFPNGTVDEVRLHHVFEHFTRQETLAMLCAWHSWLKVGGVITIETPDFDAAIHQLISSEYDYKTKQAILRHVFGSHEARWAIHCDGWYKEKYEHILTQLGFEIVTIQQKGWSMIRNIIVTAKKTSSIPANMLRTRAKNILRESFVAPSEETTMQPVWATDFDKIASQMIINY